MQYKKKREGIKNYIAKNDKLFKFICFKKSRPKMIKSQRIWILKKTGKNWKSFLYQFFTTGDHAIPT
jgi:hypothetical protein